MSESSENTSYYPIEQLKHNALNFFHQNCSNDCNFLALCRDYKVSYNKLFDYLYDNYSSAADKNDFLYKIVKYDVFNNDYKTDPNTILERVFNVIRQDFMTKDEINTRAFKAISYSNTLITPEIGQFIQDSILQRIPYPLIANKIESLHKVTIKPSSIAEYIRRNQLQSSTKFKEHRNCLVIDLYNEGVSIEDISSKLDYKQKTVQKILNDKGIHQIYKWKDEDNIRLKRIGYLRNMHLDGKTIAAIISEELGLGEPIPDYTIRELTQTYPEFIPSEKELKPRILKRRLYLVEQLYNNGDSIDSIKSKLNMSHGLIMDSLKKLKEAGKVKSRVNNRVESKDVINPNLLAEDRLPELLPEM
jgi:transposase